MFSALAAGVGEDLLDEGAAAVRGCEHVLRMAFAWRTLRRFLVEHFAVSEDTTKYVIEVVRDAAGEPADRFHLLGLAQPLLELQPLGLCALALGQIEHEGDTFIRAFFEARDADQHLHAAAIFAEILLFERWQAAGHLQLCHPSYVEVPPFRRREVRPAYATRDHILTLISQHVEKLVIGLDDPTFEIPDEDPDDVSVDQAPDLRFAFLELAVQTAVVDRHR